MSAQNVENTVENRNFLATQNDVGPAPSAAAAMTAAMVVPTGALDAAAERTSGESRSAPTTTTTMSVDDGDGEECELVGGKQLLVPVVAGNSVRSSSSGGGGGANEKRRSSDGGKRKTRRGKAKRGKRRSSSSRPYPKSQWNFLAPNVRSAANKRRSERLAAGVGLVPLKDAFRKSDQPPLVPYNTNRFLMEDHMPHVLTPSEDEEEFLTKEFSSVYEDARSERLEELSKSQLIQEYLQLEANYEQVMRRYNAAKSAKEENESGAAVNATSPNAAVSTRDAPAGTDRRRLEDRVRELTTENLELRRQLEHAARIGMVLSAKSSPRPHNSAAIIGNTLGDRMDSSSCSSSEDSEDSESDSSSSTSSSSSDDDDNGDSSSSMSDTDGNHVEVPEDRLPLMNGIEDATNPPEQHQNGFHQQLNGGGPIGEDEIPLQNGNGDHQNEASLSPRGIHSPPPPPLAMN